MSESRPPFPPFTLETAAQKVRAAEDGWNARDPERLALAYTLDGYWRNRSEFIRGRAEIVALNGLMPLRIASINDVPIKESERKYHWPLGPRPSGGASLSDLGF
jgi:nuclear transport factor 2 (NTF2) superfamily protein